MNMQTRSIQSQISFGGYIVLLFISATTRDFGVSSFVSHWGNIAVAFVEPCWKLLFWIFPMVFFLHMFADEPVLEYLKLRRHIRRGIIGGLLVSLYFVLQVIAQIVSGGHFTFTHTFNDWLNGVILVGLIEESVFRGFLYQWFQHVLAPHQDRVNASEEELDANEELDTIDLFFIRMQKWFPRKSEISAALLSTLIFAAVHFPSWIEGHATLQLMLLTTTFNVFLGLCSCALLKYSKSLWSCILVHTINNFVVSLF